MDSEPFPVAQVTLTLPQPEAHLSSMYPPILLTLNPLPFPASHPIACFVQASLSLKPAAWGGVGRGTKECLGVLLPALAPWAPRAEGFLVLLEQGTVPSPAWPHSDILGSAFPWKLGGLGVQVLSL